MKNRDENTTIIQFSYSGFTFFQSFFKLFTPMLLEMKNALLQGHLY